MSRNYTWYAVHSEVNEEEMHFWKEPLFMTPNLKRAIKFYNANSDANFIERWKVTPSKRFNQVWWPKKVRQRKKIDLIELYKEEKELRITKILRDSGLGS